MMWSDQRRKSLEFKNMTDDGLIKFETKSWLYRDQAKVAALSSASVLQFGYDLFFSILWHLYSGKSFTFILFLIRLVAVDFTDSPIRAVLSGKE